MLTTAISPQRRDEILDALRRGTVPSSSLDAFAVGLERFEATLDEELRKVSAGGNMFKAVRGEYGCGKTFFARWLGVRGRIWPPGWDHIPSAASYPAERLSLPRQMNPGRENRL
jgi:hypothetical protein